MSDIENEEISGLTPKKIVAALGKYIIGQNAAKRAVAIAIRNRARRKLVPDDMKDEIAPKNIIMIGKTGVGKTEIARRLSSLTNAPFVKEAVSVGAFSAGAGVATAFSATSGVSTSVMIIYLSRLLLREKSGRDTKSSEDRMLSFLLEQ